MVNMMRNKKGFTLVELLIVITILAIIMALAVPNIMKMGTKMKDRGYKSKAELIEKAAVNYVSSNANSIRSKLNNEYTINTDSLDNKGMKYIFGINVKKLIEEGAYTEKSSGDCTVLDPRNETKCLDCQTIIVILDDESSSTTAILDDESSSTTAILNDAESQGCTNGFIKFDNNIEIYKNVKNLS